MSTPPHKRNAPELAFSEIEHKFVVDNDFDLAGFRRTMESLTPIRTNTVHVVDRYFLTESGRRKQFVIRHRYDRELQHLTIKSVGGDSEVRSEINLNLGQHAGNQEEAVDAFLEQLGVEWSGAIHKDVAVWYFHDLEAVHYRASTDTDLMSCVEFEAIKKPSVTEALEVLERYERATGFTGRRRTHQSLPQLLFPELTDLLSHS